ncbi:MAG: tetratricopeptide repeat protein, partial [Pseudomonadota bacterium]
VTALCVLNLNVALASAQATETDLLAQLAEADEAEANRLDRELTLIWSRSGSPSMDLLLKRGREALEDEDYTTAIEHLSALTDHAPGFAQGWHLRATAFYRKGLYGPALDDLERALALNPNNYNAIFGLGVMLHEFGNLSAASELFHRVLALHPHYEPAKEALDRLAGQGVGQQTL